MYVTLIKYKQTTVQAPHDYLSHRTEGKYLKSFSDISLFTSRSEWRPWFWF